MVTDKDILLKIKEKLIAQGKPAYKCTKANGQMN